MSRLIGSSSALWIRHQARLQRVQHRSFFGIGEIVGVLSNPAETVRSLAESRRLLEEARNEIRENSERAQLRPTHTFSPLPGFFARSVEVKAIERTLENDPSFTVLFGGSSVGKTAILREVLSRDLYHVLHFDLRIAGIADLGSLYMTLSMQMEHFFESLSKLHPKYSELEKEGWTFKFDRMNVEERIQNFQGIIRTSDIARILELFQSSLLKYRNFNPELTEEEDKNPEYPRLPHKKAPVIFFDEAHKLPALMESSDVIKCLLDALIVLSKQDRLCHVIHATSDAFYQTYLRQWNVMQHAKILTIDDCDKQDTEGFWKQLLKPNIPDSLPPPPEFEELFNAFGGKFAHLQDFVQDYINQDGQLSIRTSSHYLQAYALLNFHLIHAIQSPDDSSAATGFKVYSPITQPSGPGADYASESSGDASSAPSFTAKDILKVAKRLANHKEESLSYFPLCREVGMPAVNDLVKNKVLDLRWSSAVGQNREFDAGPRLFPNTPIMRFAMGDVVEEYKTIKL